jgi:hypothetical protein
MFTKEFQNRFESLVKKLAPKYGVPAHSMFVDFSNEFELITISHYDELEYEMTYKYWAGTTVENLDEDGVGVEEEMDQMFGVTYNYNEREYFIPDEGVYYDDI